MKTTCTAMRFKHFAHYKTSAVNICTYSSLLFIMILLLGSCQKNINDVPANASTSSAQSDLQVKKINASVATDWYKLQLRFLLKKNSVLSFGGHFGYIGIGLYESVRNINPNSISLSEKLYQMPAMPVKKEGKTYNWQVSANAAMASLVRHFYIGISQADSTSIDSLENAYNQELQNTNTEEFNRSQAFGRNIATAIYNWYLTDDINLSNVGYKLREFKGAWIPTPPAFVNPPVLPYAGDARTFISAHLHGVAPKYPAYSEDANSVYYKIAKQVYNVSKNLTDEQKNIALYWVDQGDGVGYTPAGHDMSIAMQAIEQTNADLLKAAEVYAKAGIAERDATIMCFRSKYKYTLIRPVSYIQKVIDPNWLPFIPTPPHSEYPAAHAQVTGSVMQAISGVLGYHTNITDHTYDFRGWAPRNFPTIFAAGKEAGISRLYGGIHYKLSIDIGLAMAETIGTRIGSMRLGNGY
ncbi:MAG TPA: vanadium-dependent haloperoxidase [Parafilimonas sp.]|nr:vanadium-dependent haloperoxidase [Parafilimonas sp.]